MGCSVRNFVGVADGFEYNSIAGRIATAKLMNGGGNALRQGQEARMVFDK